MKKIILDDWQTFKLMSPYISLGLIMCLLFVSIQIILNKRFYKKDGESEEEK